MSEVDNVLDELASLPTMAHATASPSGSEVALYYDITGRNELHVLDVETGDLERWSDGEVPRNARWWVEWSADEDRLFFHRDEGGDEQNDIVALSRSGAVEPVVEMDGQCALADVGADGNTLLLGSSRDGQLNLYRHDLGTGETTKITDCDRPVQGASLSPDCDRFAYETNETDDRENRDVYVASVESCATGNRTASDGDDSDVRNLEIGERGAEATVADWGPGGDRLLVTDNTDDLTRVGVYELRTDDVTWYGENKYEEDAVAFLPGDDRILATRDRNALTMPVVYDLETGTGRELDVPEGVSIFGGRGYTGDVALGDGRIVFQHTTPTRRPSLLAYDLETDAYETLLEAEYGSFGPEDFADAAYFTVRSDGVPETPARAVDHDPYDELEIGVLLYDSGVRPSPLIVMPHGGPRGRDEKRFSLYTQLLVSRGFSVLKVNYRGSTGRGRAFLEQLYGDWGGAEQGDVATAVEHVLETRDWIDEDRVTVFGGSYGGYSAYWQLVQYPALYDTGIAWMGLTDLENYYETTMPHYRTGLMEKYLGTPEERPDLYEQRSPVTHVENVAAPMFVVHGVNDSRVPVSQARLFRDALQEAGYEEGKGGDFEYRELGAEGHASTDQAQKLRMFRLLDDFLKRRVGTETAATAND